MDHKDVPLTKLMFCVVYGRWGTQPSEHARAMSESRMAWCIEDLLPLMHMTADLRIAKEILHLSQPISNPSVTE